MATKPYKGGVPSSCDEIMDFFPTIDSSSISYRGREKDLKTAVNAAEKSLKLLYYQQSLNLVDKARQRVEPAVRALLSQIEAQKTLSDEWRKSSFQRDKKHQDEVDFLKRSNEAHSRLLDEQVSTSLTEADRVEERTEARVSDFESEIKQLRVDLQHARCLFDEQTGTLNESEMENARAKSEQIRQRIALEEVEKQNLKISCELSQTKLKAKELTEELKKLETYVEEDLKHTREFLMNESSRADIAGMEVATLKEELKSKELEFGHMQKNLEAAQGLSKLGEEERRLLQKTVGEVVTLKEELKSKELEFGHMQKNLETAQGLSKLGEEERRRLQTTVGELSKKNIKVEGKLEHYKGLEAVMLQWNPSPKRKRESSGSRSSQKRAQLSPRGEQGFSGCSDKSSRSSQKPAQLSPRGEQGFSGCSDKSSRSSQKPAQLSPRGEQGFSGCSDKSSKGPAESSSSSSHHVRRKKMRQQNGSNKKWIISGEK